jgi:hypothetical protein
MPYSQGMTNSNCNSAPSLDPHVLEILQTQYHRVQPPPAARRIWQRHLSAQEREKLGGDFEKAYVQGGTVGMWKRLRGVSGERALVEVSYLLGFMSEPDQQYLLRELGESPVEASTGKPVWDRDKGELLFNGQVIRRVNVRQAKNLVPVLDTFQESGWRPHIDDPLSGGKNQKRLHKTIATLNDGLSQISFHADGASEGLTWRHD